MVRIELKPAEKQVRHSSDEIAGLPEKIVELFSGRLKQSVLNIPEQVQVQVEEIRLRAAQPVIIRTWGKEWLLGESGVTDDLQHAYTCQQRDIQVLVNQISGGALYSLQEELRHGFVTIPGGHRLGFTGQVVLEQGAVKTITNLTSVNIRLARQVKGCARAVVPYLKQHDGLPWNTLIISPPQCGKTTLLRDIIRIFSSGRQGVQVGVVDERSEIAGCYRGVPQLDLGIRVDVLDRCPKAQGMIMLVRSMSPQVIATDEIGRPEDATAIWEMLNAGVRVITTVHGSSLGEVINRPQVGHLIKQRIFDRYIVLGRSLGVGTVEQILDRFEKKLLSMPLRLSSREVGSSG